MSIYVSNNVYLSASSGPGITSDNPIIGYNSVLTPDDITVPSTTSIRPPVNMWTPDTSIAWEGEAYSGVMATLTQNIVLANTGLVSVDYVGIAKHNLGTGEFVYKVQRSDDAITWFDVTPPKIKSTNNPIVEYFDPDNSPYFRIQIEKTATDIVAPIIAHVKLGVALVLQRRIYVGHSPASLAKNVKKQSYGSESGQYLGQVVIRSYRNTQVEQENNTPEFVRASVVPFINHVNGHNEESNTAQATFFFSWRPTKYPDDIIYGWTKDNIQPENQGGDSFGGRMKWGFSIEAIG
jgi:hypothetical protein